MNESKIRRLMSLDEGLPEDRHDLIKERVMNSIRADQQAEGSRTARPVWMRRRFAPALAAAFAVLLAGTAVAGALGMLPQQATDLLDWSDCRNPDSIEEMVAEAAAPDGGSYQMWTSRVSPDAPVNGHILVDFNADGKDLGSFASCNPVGGDPTDNPPILWADLSSIGNDEGTLGSIMGHAPSEASSVVVTFKDGTSEQIETQIDGYFLGVAFRSDVRGETGWPEVVHLTALDADGNTIMEEDMP